MNIGDKVTAEYEDGSPEERSDLAGKVGTITEHAADSWWVKFPGTTLGACGDTWILYSHELKSALTFKVGDRVTVKKAASGTWGGETGTITAVNPPLYGYDWAVTFADTQGSIAFGDDELEPAFTFPVGTRVLVLGDSALVRHKYAPNTVGTVSGERYMGYGVPTVRVKTPTDPWGWDVALVDLVPLPSIPDVLALDISDTAKVAAITALVG